ncbi:MAG: PQQ-binding-like beta-propeller repeat protein [Phycisphaerales bacterium]|nr:PQQ-binding-like beta-propeller repeat protein [Phycisphaerales bacterium]
MSNGKAWRAMITLGVLASAMGALGPAAGCKKQASGPASAAAEPAPAAESGKPADPVRAAKDRQPTAFEKLGYKLSWIGVPTMEAGSRIKFLDAFGDIVAVHDTGNTVSVMEATTGANRWSVDMGGSLAKYVGNARQGDVLIVASETDLSRLDVRTGELKARQRLAHLANTRPLIVDNVAVFGCTAGEILGHNMLNGFHLWSYRMEGTVRANPVLCGGAVAAVSEGGEIVFLDPATGTIPVRRQTIFGGIDNSPVTNDMALFIAARDQSVWAFSRSDGRQMWRVRTDTRLTAQPALDKDHLYVTVPGEGLVCFEAPTGKRLWNSPKAAGTVVGVRAGRLLAWDAPSGSAMLIDPAKGDLIDTQRLEGVARLLIDGFTDGSLYVALDNGEVRKYIPERQ